MPYLNLRRQGIGLNLRVGSAPHPEIVYQQEDPTAALKKYDPLKSGVYLVNSQDGITLDICTNLAMAVLEAAAVDGYTKEWAA